MKIIIAVMVGSLAASPVWAVNTWSTITKTLGESIVFLEGKQGSCTGFVIDNDRDHVLTAAHCDMDDKTYVDLVPAKIVAKDTKNDLLVLKVEGIDRPALRLAKTDPQLGDEVASYGFGYGLEKPIFRIHHISQIGVQFPNLPGIYIATDTPFVGGQSGGPVVNTHGEVVLIVQMSDVGALGIGIPASFIEAKMGRYFEGRDK